MKRSVTKNYINPKRKQGSQQETPKLVVKENQLYVSGYQQFVLTKSVNNPKNVSVNIQPSVYRGKFAFLAQACLKLAGLGNMKTLMDLGCSNGLLCFLALASGLETVWGLDHDTECLRLINRAVQILGISPNQLETRSYKFGDSTNTHILPDIVTACALIHWVYSCTASFGSLSSIIEYLSKITGKVLIVEWVDPSDKAIQSFHHLSFNRQVAREPYTRQNFEKALQTWFTGGFRKIYTVNSTRQLYIAVKPGFESILSLFVPIATVTTSKSIMTKSKVNIKSHPKHKTTTTKTQRAQVISRRSRLISSALKKFA